jgi:hypothetical protein
VKIWDVRTYGCMQTLVERDLASAEDRVFAIAYDSGAHRLMTATSCMQQYVVASPALLVRRDTIRSVLTVYPHSTDA